MPEEGRGGEQVAVVRPDLVEACFQRRNQVNRIPPQRNGARQGPGRDLDPPQGRLGHRDERPDVVFQVLEEVLPQSSGHGAGERAFANVPQENAGELGNDQRGGAQPGSSPGQ